MNRIYGFRFYRRITRPYKGSLKQLATLNCIFETLTAGATSAAHHCSRAHNINTRDLTGCRASPRERDIWCEHQYSSDFIKINPITTGGQHSLTGGSSRLPRLIELGIHELRGWNCFRHNSNTGAQLRGPDGRRHGPQLH